MLFQFIRDRKNRRIGTMVSFVPEGFDVPVIGWALCRKSDLKNFTKEFGQNIATNRAMIGSVVPIPHSIRTQYDKFIDRSNRYFKNEKEMSNAETATTAS